MGEGYSQSGSEELGTGFGAEHVDFGGIKKPDDSEEKEGAYLSSSGFEESASENEINSDDESKKEKFRDVKEYVENAETIATDDDVEKMFYRLQNDSKFAERFLREGDVEHVWEIKGCRSHGNGAISDEQKMEILTDLVDKYLDDTKPGDASITANTPDRMYDPDPGNPTVLFLDKSRTLRFQEIDPEKIEGHVRMSDEVIYGIESKLRNLGLLENDRKFVLEGVHNLLKAEKEVVKILDKLDGKNFDIGASEKKEAA